MQENGRESFEKVDFAAKLKENRRKHYTKKRNRSKQNRYHGIAEYRNPDREDIAAMQLPNEITATLSHNERGRAYKAELCGTSQSTRRQGVENETSI